MADVVQGRDRAALMVSPQDPSQGSVLSQHPLNSSGDSWLALRLRPKDCPLGDLGQVIASP